MFIATEPGQPLVTTTEELDTLGAPHFVNTSNHFLHAVDQPRKRNIDFVNKPCFSGDPEQRPRLSEWFKVSKQLVTGARICYRTLSGC